MKQKILVTKEQRSKLKETFSNVTNVFIGQSLSYERNSELAIRIREAAFQMGGQLVEIAITPIKHEVRTVKILDSKGRVVAKSPVTVV